MLGDTEIVVNGKLAFVQFHDVCPVGCDQCHVVFDFIVHSLVVDVNILKRRVEEVAPQTYGAAGLFINQRRILGGFLYFRHCIFPMLDQDFKLSVEFGHAFAFGHCADNHTEVFRFDAHQQLFQAGTFFARFNLLRNGNLIIKRDQYQIASGKRNFGCQSWSLGRDRLLNDLHHHFLSDL